MASLYTVMLAHLCRSNNKATFCFIHFGSRDTKVFKQFLVTATFSFIVINVEF